METVHDLPRRVRCHEHLWIPLPDGTRLAARLWLPEGADREPEPARLTVDTAGSTLSLPVRHDTAGDDAIRDPGPARGAPAGEVVQRVPRDYGWHVLRDLAADHSVLKVRKDEGESHLVDPDLTLRIRTLERYSHTGNDYASVRGETWGERTLSRGDWAVTVRTRTVLSSDAEHFHLRAELDGYEGDRRVHSHNLERSIARDLM